jgi:hypothetical protein
MLDRAKPIRIRKRQALVVRDRDEAGFGKLADDVGKSRRKIASRSLLDGRLRLYRLASYQKIAAELGRTVEATVAAASKLKLSLRTRFHFGRTVSGRDPSRFGRAR